MSACLNWYHSSPAGGIRFDHERLQRFVDGVEKGFFAGVGQRRAEQRKIELAPDHGGDDQRPVRERRQMAPT
jgi:hypothetical protein